MNEPISQALRACVVVGASAGGLTPMRQLLRGLAANTNIAVVVIQHLPDTHATQLPELLAEDSALEVELITDGMPVRSERVFVAPAGQRVGIEAGQFVVTPADVAGPPSIIDHLFAQAADVYGARCIGVLLSGSGRDGAHGLAAIGRAGGMTLVQDPDTADYAGMPDAARQQVDIDVVADIDALSERLATYCKPPAEAVAAPTESPSFVSRAEAIDDQQLTQVLDLLAETARDMHIYAYKPSMLKRRIDRRMAIAGVPAPADYIQRLADNADERARLIQDFLISVTAFFRYDRGYAQLAEAIETHLLADRHNETPLRIWVPGCATGEEAYSIAIALAELFAARGMSPAFTIFASDIDAQAIDIARRGVYPASIAEQLCDSQLARYFEPVGRGQYRFRHALRERIVFAEHNVVADPPYSRLDMISCRNLLMYLKPGTQRELIDTFHFALAGAGLLLLGDSESLGEDRRFVDVAGDLRLFRRLGQTADNRRVPARTLQGWQHPAAALGRDPRRDETGTGVERALRELLLREHVPATVVVDTQLSLVANYGPTEHYLRLPLGQSSFELEALIRDRYRYAVKTLISQVSEHRSPRETTLDVHEAGQAYRVSILAQPVSWAEAVNPLIMVIFRATPATPAASDGLSNDEDSTEASLRAQLTAAQDELTATIQALEASNTDLRSSHEELLSMNEELQSTNEELETSKEELQSLNEELVTVNGELEDKVAELEHANDDLANLFSGMRVATLFLDPRLGVRRYTPPVTDLFNLIESDIGRPITDITLRFCDADLIADCRAVMADLREREAEVPSAAGRWYQRRILPYRKLNDQIDGVVITFAEITELKQVSLASRASEHRLDLAMKAINGGMWEMRVDPEAPDDLPDTMYISARLKALLGYDDGQLPNSLSAWRERIDPADRPVFDNVTRRQSERHQQGIEYRIRHRDNSQRWFASYGSLVVDTDLNEASWIGIDCDITDIKRIDAHIEQARDTLVQWRNAVGLPTACIDRAGRVHSANRAFERLFGAPDADRDGPEWLGEFGVYHVQDYLDAVLATRATTTVETRVTSADAETGQTYIMRVVPHMQHDEVAGAFIVFDMPQARHAGPPLDEDDGRMVHLQRMAMIGEIVSSLTHEVRQPLMTIRNYANTLARQSADGQQDIPAMAMRIDDQARRADHVVAQTRRLIGQGTDVWHDYDLIDLINASLALIERRAQKQNVLVHVDAAAHLPTLHGDSAEIEQILVNLLTNALDALSDAEAERRIDISVQQPDATRIRVRIRDTGPGIAEEVLGHIFESFYTRQINGMGLGLAISRRLADHHGGQLWAEAGLQRGACFVLDLPVGAVPETIG